MFNCKKLFKLQIRPPSLILLITTSQDRWIFPSQSREMRNSMMMMMIIIIIIIIIGSELRLGIYGALYRGVTTCEWTVSKKIYLRMNSVQGNMSENGQYPTECMTVVSVPSKIYDSCQLAEQNTPQRAVSNRIHLTVNSCLCPTNSSQMPVCPTKYTSSCQCVQQNILAAANVFNKTDDSCQCVQQNTPHCVDSVQQNTPDSEQSTESNKFITVASVSNKIYWQLPVCSTKYDSCQCPTKYT